MSDLPAGWRLVKFSDIADCSLGKMLNRGKSRGYPVVPYLRNANVQWAGVQMDDLATMELSSEETERYSVNAGDLLVCEGGEIGRAAILPLGSGRIAYQKALHRVRSCGEVDLRYLRHLLESYARSGLLLKYSTGSTIKHLPQQQLKNLPVPLPPLKEQRRIIDVLEDHLSRLDAAHQYLMAAQQRSTSLRRTLLTAAFTARLTGRSTDTEVVEEIADSQAAS